MENNAGRLPPLRSFRCPAVESVSHATHEGGVNAIGAYVSILVLAQNKCVKIHTLWGGHPWLCRREGAAF